MSLLYLHVVSWFLDAENLSLTYFALTLHANVTLLWPKSIIYTVIHILCYVQPIQLKWWFEDAIWIFEVRWNKKEQLCTTYWRNDSLVVFIFDCEQLMCHLKRRKQPYRNHILKSNPESCPQFIVGIWYSKQCRENGLQCIDINTAGSLLAMCDKQGYLCLFQHPCTTDGVS